MKSTAIIPTGGQTVAATIGHGDRLIEAFLAGRNKRTQTAYSRDLEDFRAHAAQETVSDLAGWLLSLPHGEANGAVLDYRASMVDRGLGSATINRRLASVRSMVKLANVLGMVPWKLEVANVKGQSYRDTRGPGKAGFNGVLTLMEGRRDAKGLRDLAAVRLLHDLGLRRGEVVSLDLEHVDLDLGTVSVLGKGRTEREAITLPDQTQAALAEWLQARGEWPGPLFTSFDNAGKGDGRLTGAGLYAVVRRLGDLAGIKLRPHGLRHLAITSALDLTEGNTRAVQRFSRHRDIRTLQIYDDNRTDLGGEVAKMVAAGA